MPKVVLKLFAGQGTGRTDKAATICFPFWEYNNTTVQSLLKAHSCEPSYLKLFSC